MEAATIHIIEKIDAMGGAVSAIEQGYIQDQIASASYQYQQAVERNEKIIVGVNKYKSEDLSITPIMKIDPLVEQMQKERLKVFKQNRNLQIVQEKLLQIQQVAKSNDNLMPIVIDAVEHHCTLGEIANALREIWGEFKG
jgi:methylmalonyl-CoA mutase, N-terminal domain